MDRKLLLQNKGDDETRELFELLNKLKTLLRKGIHQQFNRSLPLADELFDRWERASFLGFGEGSSVYDSSLILGEVECGIKTWIGPFTVIDGSGKLKIGDFCNISAGAQIYSHDSVDWVVSGGEKEYLYSETIIGNRCYIGPNAIISKGVVLGDGCVVGANSFVNKSFDAGSKIAGSPAKLIG